MLASAATIDVVAHTLREWQEKTGQQLEIILDPVRMTSSLLLHCSLTLPFRS